MFNEHNKHAKFICDKYIRQVTAERKRRKMSPNAFANIVINNGGLMGKTKKLNAKVSRIFPRGKCSLRMRKLLAPAR